MKINRISLILSVIIFSALLLGTSLIVRQTRTLSHIFDIFYKKTETKIVYKAEETIKILEGWTNQDIANYFQSIGKWKAEDVLTIIDSASSTQTFSKQFIFLDESNPPKSLEGYLFPDTYRIYASSTITEAIDKMLVNFDHKLTLKMREDIKKQGKTISEIVIMASIIEKEAPFYAGNDNSAAKIVSGIFWNRIKNGQALQSDATLSYIYKDNKPSHSGEELNNPSLYNTYKYRGLPPGPICNPGLLSLEAAIYYTDTDYNYFLTAPDGSIYYAKTFAEHSKNIYKYLK